MENELIKIEVTGKDIKECLIYHFDNLDNALLFIKLSRKFADEEQIFTII